MCSEAAGTADKQHGQGSERKVRRASGRPCVAERADRGSRPPLLSSAADTRDSLQAEPRGPHSRGCRAWGSRKLKVE